MPLEIVNLADAEAGDEPLDLGGRLGASTIGASLYVLEDGDRLGPYHFHDGIEEWLVVVSGRPVLRVPAGERVLEPGELVTFPNGPEGAHTAFGPGRLALFSVGDRGAGEAFVSVYPDSDKLAAAPGVIFRRADAIRAWREEPVPVGERDWATTRHALTAGEVATAFHYEWCRETWLLVAHGEPTLRHADGVVGLRAGDVCCLPQGPAGSRQLSNDGAAVAEVLAFTSPVGRPSSTFFPDDGTVCIATSDGERRLFRVDDQVDYSDGEPS